MGNNSRQARKMDPRHFAACGRIGCTGSASGVTTTRAALQRLSDFSDPSR